MPRYALYYAPHWTSPWQQWGAAWLGRSSLDDQPVEQFRIDGLEAAVLRSLTDTPRRYGFHATLKAPFRLAVDAILPDLIGALDRFCSRHCAIDLPAPEAIRMGSFLALGWSVSDDRVAAVAADCVTRFDEFRAPLESAELLRRRGTGLTVREDQLLLRWGYPHVLDAFRLHMSLTGPLGNTPSAVVRRLHEAAGQAIAALAGTPFCFDAISVYEEPAPGARFRLLHRSPLGVDCGRLIYIVGPSGAGKDSLIDYVRKLLPDDSGVRFARRTITRPAESGGEDHIAVSPAQFEQLEAQHTFAMAWRANELAYGVGKEITAWLAVGDTVVVNGSRSYAAAAARTFSQLEVIEIDADPEVIGQRLRSRGREKMTDINARMSRVLGAWNPTAGAVRRITNNGPLELAGDQLLAVLSSPDVVRTAAQVVGKR